MDGIATEVALPKSKKVPKLGAVRTADHAFLPELDLA